MKFPPPAVGVNCAACHRASSPPGVNTSPTWDPIAYVVPKPIDCMLGEVVSWSIRPENILLFSEQEKHNEQRKNLFPAIITSIVNKGASSLVSVEIIDKGIMLVAEVANNTFNDLMKKVGDKCIVQIKKKGIVVFDKNNRNINSRLSVGCPKIRD